MVQNRELVTFLSYSSKDRGFAWRLAADLEFAGAVVWLDRTEIQWHDDEPNPDDEDEYVWGKLEEGIQKAHHFIPLLSPDALCSRWVNAEMKLAQQRGTKIILVACRPCKLPDNMSGLALFDFTSTTKYDGSVEELLHTMGLQKELGPLGKISGYWRYTSSEADATDGMVVLSQRGKHVIARVDYITSNSGKIRGTFVDNCLRYRWKNSLEEGIGQLIYDASKDVLDGYFIRGGMGPKVAWQLNKTSEYWEET